jgi:membrane protease YdiL (CAAX protease family)
MDCPHCLQAIADTAVRCKYCRLPVNGAPDKISDVRVKDLIDRAFGRLRAFFLDGRQAGACSWSFVDIVLILILLWLFITNDPFHIGSNILKYLRLHYPAFAGDPKLLYYLTVHLNTMIFKVVSVALVVILVKARRASFNKTVLSRGDVPELWWKLYLPIYVIVCLVVRDVSALNPLLPNLPFDSVYTGSKLLGNAVVIFSVIFIAPFVEEVIFRGFLYPAFNKYMGMHPAVILTSVLFTAAHNPQSSEDVVYAVTLFSLSLMITYARAKTGSTLFAILMHHIYNLIYVVVGIANYLVLKY